MYAFCEVEVSRRVVCVQHTYAANAKKRVAVMQIASKPVATRNGAASLSYAMTGFGYCLCCGRAGSIAVTAYGGGPGGDSCPLFYVPKNGLPLSSCAMRLSKD